MKRITSAFFLVFIIVLSCRNEVKNGAKINGGELSVKTLSDSAIVVRNYVKENIVIAHRGSEFWAPEETEPAFRWARNMGADYLEFDVQLTKDSALVAFHDNNLSRTTNIAEVFPGRVELGINDFTLKELRSLDAGSWFNSAHPDRAMESYKGLKILTLEDVVMIAEGYMIKSMNGIPEKVIRDGEWTGHYTYEKDPADNGHRPGIYVETKNPKPGVERILAVELEKSGWNINENPGEIETEEGKVCVANTNARVILQSFSRRSIEQLEQHLPGIPKCLLLWHPKMEDDLKSKYVKNLNFAADHNVHIMGTSIAGEPNNYGELTAPWMTDLIHSSGMLIHPYTFDTERQLNEYGDRIEGLFTNRVDMVLELYDRGTDTSSPEECFIELGYH
ncbi:MAG: glycerophosphodiester phosphodiesterase family protein [Bacteroidota bacterium]